MVFSAGWPARSNRMCNRELVGGTRIHRWIPEQALDEYKKERKDCYKGRENEPLRLVNLKCLLTETTPS